MLTIDDEEEDFIYEDNEADGFSLRLISTSIQADNYFQITATAEGGATVTAMGSMRITAPEYDCTTAIVSTPVVAGPFDLPEKGKVLHELVSGHLSYVTEPALGC